MDALVCKVILGIQICTLISAIIFLCHFQLVHVLTDTREGVVDVMVDDSDGDDDYPIHYEGRGKWNLKLLECDEKGSCHHREITKSYSGNRSCCIRR